MFIYLKDIIMNEITLITAFFNLSSIDGSVSKSFNKYFELADYIFKLNCNIIFYVEPENYMKIWNGRKKYNMLNKTLIITKNLKELKYFDKYDEANQFNKKSPLMMQDKNKHTTSYLLFMYNKVELVDEAIKLNPFNNKTFGWIDFGIDYITKGFDLSKILEYPSVKVKICEVVHIPKSQIVSKQLNKIATNYVARTVGGFWMGNVIMMNIFINEFRKWADILWQNELLTYDENIYEYILQLNPEITEKYYGRYWYFFENWTMIMHYDEWFLRNMSSCRLNNEHTQVIDMFKKLKVYKWNELNNLDKFDVYLEAMISSFYIDFELYVKYCEEFIYFVESNKTDIKLLENVINKKDMITQNLNFAKKDLDVKLLNILD